MYAYERKITQMPNLTERRLEASCFNFYSFSCGHIILLLFQVSFPVGDGLVEVHSADDLERKGPWEQIAVDRRRFQSRIASVESVLAPVLSVEHRQKVYRQIYPSATE